MNTGKKVVDRIDDIIHNHRLAASIYTSIQLGIQSKSIHLTGRNAWGVFEYSLNAAIRDIETHPRGKLFRRLLEYGPLNPDDPEKPTSDCETVLSDPECGECVQFIFSHMVNRFKGELAELLAIQPVLGLIEQLRVAGKWSDKVHLYFGETI